MGAAFGSYNDWEGDDVGITAEDLRRTFGEFEARQDAKFTALDGKVDKILNDRKWTRASVVAASVMALAMVAGVLVNACVTTKHEVVLINPPAISLDAGAR